MTVSEQLNELAKQQVGMWILAYPTSTTEGMMTGAVKAGVRTDGLVKVLYEDQTVEERYATADLLGSAMDELGLMKLVGFVQEGRNLCQG